MADGTSLGKFFWREEQGGTWFFSSMWRRGGAVVPLLAAACFFVLLLVVALAVGCFLFPFASCLRSLLHQCSKLSLCVVGCDIYQTTAVSSSVWIVVPASFFGPSAKNSRNPRHATSRREMLH